MTMKSPTPRPGETRDPAADELKAAYQVHTLVQMLTARLTGTPQWTPVVHAPFPPLVH
jgi:hypothetical protein